MLNKILSWLRPKPKEPPRLVSSRYNLSHIELVHFPQFKWNFPADTYAEAENASRDIFGKVRRALHFSFKASITPDIPNGLLARSEPINVYITAYGGATTKHTGTFTFGGLPIMEMSVNLYIPLDDDNGA